MTHSFTPLTVAILPKLDINIDQVTRQLEDEGVEKFNKPFDKILQTLASSSSRR
jgi:transaldolase